MYFYSLYSQRDTGNLHFIVSTKKISFLKIYWVSHPERGLYGICNAQILRPYFALLGLRLKSLSISM